MRAGHVATAAGIGLILVTVDLAHASMVTMQMGGQITSSSNPSLTGINAGDTWNLTYTFDSEATDTYYDPGYGQYSQDSISFTVNGQPLSVEQRPGQIYTANDVTPFYPPPGPYDHYGVDAWFEPFGGFSDNWPALHIYLDDFDTSVLSSESLPLSPLPLSEFEWISFDIQDMLNGGYMAEGTVTYWTPEPTGLWLLILGSLAVVTRRTKGF